MCVAGAQIEAKSQQRSNLPRHGRGQQGAASPPEYVPSVEETQQFGQGVGNSLAHWAADTDKLDLELVAQVIAFICR